LRASSTLPVATLRIKNIPGRLGTAWKCHSWFGL
jgi:hypothetical protein